MIKLVGMNMSSGKVLNPFVEVIFTIGNSENKLSHIYYEHENVNLKTEQDIIKDLEVKYISK